MRRTISASALISSGNSSATGCSGGSTTATGARASDRRAEPGARPWLRTRTPFRESGALLGTLEGHSSAVYACAVSPDGSFIVSASWDETLKLWDRASGRELRTLAGHTDMVNACAVSPDGSFTVSASNDHTLKLWDPVSGQELRTLKGHGSGVSSCAVSPDGSFTVSASGDHTLKLWDPASGRELRTSRAIRTWSTPARSARTGASSSRPAPTRH